MTRVKLSPKRGVLPQIRATFLFFVGFSLVMIFVYTVQIPLVLRLRGSEENCHRRRRRHFLRYHSSEWEQLWLDNIGTWESDRKICQEITGEEQLPYLRDFISVFCTVTHKDWCLVDDGVSHKPWWFHLSTGKVATQRDPPPLEVLQELRKQSSSPMPAMIRPELLLKNPRKVFSRMDFRNDYTGEQWTEYIEPLVSHLRHPLSFCNYAIDFSDRSFLVPPPELPPNTKAYYFDAGASKWNDGKGGPSLSFFAEVWKRHGIDFHHMKAWEGEGTPSDFYKSVPALYKDRVLYHQEWIASSPKEAGPFLPSLIERQTSIDDYVVFKLDIDNGPVEKGSVEYLLKHPEYVDEFVWEHHAGGNYLLKQHWYKTADDLSVKDSYQYFLKLRQKGIRAHSWV